MKLQAFHSYYFGGKSHFEDNEKKVYELIEKVTSINVN